MMLGSVFFAAGLFLFGWTSNPGILWVPSVFGAIFIGFGSMCIFQACLNYLIDTFQASASSAMAANAFVRASMAGAFPLFAPALFHNLTIPWASTLLALIAVLMIPIPFFFFAFGFRIRARGKLSKASTY
jgi:MFS family permease